MHKPPCLGEYIKCDHELRSTCNHRDDCHIAYLRWFSDKVYEKVLEISKVQEEARLQELEQRRHPKR